MSKNKLGGSHTSETVLRCLLRPHWADTYMRGAVSRGNRVSYMALSCCLKNLRKKIGNKPEGS